MAPSGRSRPDRDRWVRTSDHGPVLVRSPSEDELVHLQEIERAAGQRYRDYGLGHVADDEPAPLEVLAGYARGGRTWVAISGTTLVVGYVLVDVIDGCAHIEQVSVTPAHQGQGAGRALIDQVTRIPLPQRSAGPAPRSSAGTAQPEASH